FVVKAVKRAYFLEKLRRKNAESVAAEGAVSFAVYGSFASGEYDEKSDVDLLIIGRREQLSEKGVAELEKKLGKRIQVTVVPPQKWEKGRQGEPFAQSVLRNHVLLKGMPL
ncbi:MAG: nucleotidyltransferase domain-containing protein, partial [Candidatus Micrarchaeota archaeon]